jgi:hypothetical protein
MPWLTRLELSGNDHISDFAPLEALINLVYLRLDATTFCEKDAVHLKYMDYLRALNLADLKIRGGCLDNLVGMRMLDELNLTNTQVQDVGLGSLKGLPISSLFLGNTKITDVGLREVCNVQSLEEIELNNNAGITDQGIQFLANLPALRSVDLSYTSITENTLGLLCRNAVLANLDIAGVHISEAGIASLMKCANLRRLRIELVDESTVESLRLIGQHRKIEQLIVGTSLSETNGMTDQLRKGGCRAQVIICNIKTFRSHWPVRIRPWSTMPSVIAV